jgi:hypothetical protein
MEKAAGIPAIAIPRPAILVLTNPTLMVGKYALIAMAFMSSRRLGIARSMQSPCLLVERVDWAIRVTSVGGDRFLSVTIVMLIAWVTIPPQKSSIRSAFIGFMEAA